MAICARRCWTESPQENHFWEFALGCNGFSKAARKRRKRRARDFLPANARASLFPSSRRTWDGTRSRSTASHACCAGSRAELSSITHILFARRWWLRRWRARNMAALSPPRLNVTTFLACSSIRKNPRRAVLRSWRTSVPSEPLQPSKPNPGLPGSPCLAKRIIACLDVDAGRVVKGIQFQQLRDAGDPAELARAHAQAGADEIVLLDITATSGKRKTLVETVRRAARELFVPFTVGGGVRTLDDAAAIFDAGADKVTVNSAAVANPGLIGEIAGRFGSQAVIVAIDARRGDATPDEAEVFVAGGRTATGKCALAWAREAEGRGAGEILLTSMDRDGTGTGFDCELTAAASAAVSIPVIASGGAGSAAHFVEVLSRGRADAALAASIFHFGTHAIADLKQTLLSAGVPMRWPC